MKIMVRVDLYATSVDYKEYYSRQRRTWGDIDPVTRSVPSGKTYNQKKEKERISKEFRDGFGADFLLD